VPAAPVAARGALDRDNLDLVAERRRPFGEVLNDAFATPGMGPVVAGEMEDAHPSIYNRPSGSNPRPWM
jgi:hypothetical protein